MASALEIQDAQRRFNENFQAIAAAKEQTGDWEKAYQLVTGQVWPQGQNVRIKDGQGTAIDDLPWWRDAAKYAGPIAGIAAAPFTSGLSAALIGAGAGAAGSAIGGGGAKDALLWGALGAGAGYGADKLLGAGAGAGQGGSYVSDAVGNVATQAGGGGGLSAALKKLAGAAIPVGAAVAGRAAGGGGGMSPETQQLLAMAMKRIQDQEPLFQAVNRQALAGLPTSYQR